MLYSVKDAAEYLELAVVTIKYHIYESGHLRPQKVGGTLVFTQEELDRFKEEVPSPGWEKGKPRK